MAFGGFRIGVWLDGSESMVWKVWSRVVSVVRGPERRVGDEGGEGMILNGLDGRTSGVVVNSGVGVTPDLGVFWEILTI